jgi:hypothetical protein
MSHSRSDPDFWMYDTSGVMRPAVTAYLKGKPMTAKDIAAMRIYLRVWIFAPEFDGGEGVEALRQTEVLTFETIWPRRTLFDRDHRLASQTGEGLNFPFQGERLGCEAPMLQRVPVASRSAATGSVHPADAIPPNRRRSAL